MGEALRGVAGDGQRPLELLLGEQLLGVAVEPVARGVGAVAAFGDGFQLAARAGEVAALAQHAGQPRGGLDAALVAQVPERERLDRVAQRGLRVVELAVAVERYAA